MSFFRRSNFRAWLLVPLGALGFLTWTSFVRIQRVEYVSGLAGRAETADAVDAASPTGYARGQRELIVPEHNIDSYNWIIQTQQMLVRGDARVRHVDYDNAPFGRAVHAASPYRWWLGLVAWGNHLVTGRPLALAVERAALYADPLLQLLLLVGATLLAARRFGVFPAALLSVGLVTVFPFASGFLPGAPDHHGLAQICALASVLLLLAGFVPVRDDAAQRSKNASGGRVPPETAAPMSVQAARWFVAAGVAGGCGLWISASSQLPLILGIVVGGIIAAAVTRGESTAGLPWRAWALSGATTSLLAYLVEYYPAQMDLRLQANHPLFGLAWLGGGELLHQLGTPGADGRTFWSLRRVTGLVLGVAAMAALPATMIWTKTQGLFSVDPFAARLTGLPNGAVAQNLGAWLGRDGFTAMAGATLLPLLILGPAVWLLIRRRAGHTHRMALAVATGPVWVTLVLAFYQLRWCNQLDGALLAVAVAVTTAIAATGSRGRLWLWSGAFGFIAILGLAQLLPQTSAATKNVLTQLEVESLVERDLAHWLAKHAGTGGAVVLAPPFRTTSLCFYGGLRGLGTLCWENQEGLAATARIVSATSPDEALALIRRRDVTLIVIPSWDPYLDEYARLGSSHPEDSFIVALHRWALPPWVRPVPYQLPTIGGFEGQSVVILEVVDEQDNATALSRLAEYFIEMEQVGLAASVGQALRTFPSNPSALVALTAVETARGDAPAAANVFATLLSNLSAGSDRSLPWDRRVSLAVVLAQGKRMDLAHTQVERCLAGIDEARLRSLTTASLYRLQVLAKAFELKIAQPQLQALALDLLPPALRERL